MTREGKRGERAVAVRRTRGFDGLDGLDAQATRPGAASYSTLRFTQGQALNVAFCGKTMEERASLKAFKSSVVSCTTAFRRCTALSYLPIIFSTYVVYVKLHGYF